MSKRVHVCVPTMSNSLNVALHGFLQSLERSRWAAGEFDFSYHICNGLHPVEYARNVLVGTALKTDAERVWFIDQDMMPDASAFKMLGVDADIVGARMLRFDHENPITGSEVGIACCAFLENPDAKGRYFPVVPLPNTPAVQEVDAVGTGCMLVRRHVLEDREMWLDGKYQTLDGTTKNCAVDYDSPRYAPPVFRFPRKPNGEPLIGEDLDFCRRAKARGYKIMTHWNATVGHYKSVDLDQVANLASLSAQRAQDAGNGDQRRTGYAETMAKIAREQNYAGYTEVAPSKS